MVAKKSQEAFETAFKVSQETVEGALKTSAQAMQKNFEQTFETTKKRVEEAVKGYGDFAAVGKENIEAVVASGAAAAKGFEAINAEFLSLSKKAYEANVEALKSLTTAKSPKEFFEIQSNLFKDSYKHLVAESSKLGELGKSVATDALEPINTRVTAAVENFSKQFAI